MTNDVITKARKRLRSLLDRRLKTVIFSHNPGHFHTFLRIKAVNLYIKLVQKSTSVIGALWFKPTRLSVEAAKVGLVNNLNHLGNSYAMSYDKLGISQKIEHKVIEWTKELLGVYKQDIEGYVTSGGTEANLFLMWIGREYLSRKNKGPSVVLLSDFTHYSIRKAGRILGLQEIKTPVSEESWGTDIKGVGSSIKNLIDNNIKNILLPITLGYSSTGACDPLEEMLGVVKALTLQHKDLNVFVWVDAAMQGLPFAFLDKSFKPFSKSLVQGLIIDYHKLGGTPIPAGVVLYRQKLREFIQTPIDYLEEDDTTILGSRPGFSALAIWANIFGISQEKWRGKFIRLGILKEDFIRRFKRKFPKATVITTKHSLTCGIVINEHFGWLPREIESKYGLNRATVEYRTISNRVKKLSHYKIFFLPHLNQRQIKQLMKDISFKAKTR